MVSRRRELRGGEPGDARPTAGRLSGARAGAAARRGAGAIVLALQVALACARPDPLERARLNADADLAAGHADAAAAAYRAILAGDPDDLHGWRGLARAELERGDPAAARSALAELDARLGGTPQPATPLHCDVWRASLQGPPAEAEPDALLDWAERSERGGCPGGEAAEARVRAWLDRARRALAASDPEAALAAYRSAADAPRPPVEAFAGAARILIGEARYAEAVALLADGLAEHPADRGLQELMVTALAEGRITFP